MQQKIEAVEMALSKHTVDSHGMKGAASVTCLCGRVLAVHGLILLDVCIYAQEHTRAHCIQFPVTSTFLPLTTGIEAPVLHLHCRTCGWKQSSRTYNTMTELVGAPGQSW